MTLWDLLYQASFWQWLGIIHLAWVFMIFAALAVGSLGPIITFIRKDNK